MNKPERYEFTREIFKEYYEKWGGTIYVCDIDKREIGLRLFPDIMRRHLHFTSQEVLREYIKSVVPRHAYRSVSYYLKPDEEMSKKERVGCELLFDLDADYLDRPCSMTHDYWKCSGCGYMGRGAPPKRCPKCGSVKFERFDWICDKCIETVKGETIKLINYLTEDFGFSFNDLRVVFTGNRGFHIIVSAESVLDLGEEERREIVSYLSGDGLNPRLILRYTSNTLYPQSLDSPAWIGRITKYIAKNSDSKIREWLAKGKPLRLNEKRYRNLVRLALEAIDIYKVKLDPVVTPDLTRMTRIPNTLHGSTGWRVYSLKPKELEDFDISRVITLGTEDVKIKTSFSPAFKMLGQQYGPFKDSVETILPLHIAVLMELRGRGTIIGFA